MGMNGTDLLLLANTGTAGAPTYEVVGCQRDATIEESSDTIDVSCKDSRAMRVLPGRFSGSISLDALYVPTDAAYLALRAANRNGELILVAREVDGVVEETVNAKIDSMSESFPDQAEATISISLTIDGFWAEVGS
jgi:TP901-1 family phage major tail protein